MNTLIRLIFCFLASSAFAQSPVLISTKVANVDPPTIHLSWTAVSAPTPDYDVYESYSFVINGCPAVTAGSWKKVGDALTTTTLDRQIPITGYGTPISWCWYVVGYQNGVPTAPSNLANSWIAAGGYFFFGFVEPDPITGGCSLNTSQKLIFPYPYSSGGNFTIVRSLNGVDTPITSLAGPVFYKNTAGQITAEGFAFHVNVLDEAVYWATATFPDGYQYSFQIFTNWAGVPASKDFYTGWSINKLFGSGEVCRRSYWQDEQPTL